MDAALSKYQDRFHDLRVLSYLHFFFFFQAEDGIRDHCVTGVQTCALPIDRKSTRLNSSQAEDGIRDHCVTGVQTCALPIDRKSTRLNSSHTVISYAVFCLRSEERRVGQQRSEERRVGKECGSRW